MKTYDLIRSPPGDPPLPAFHECLMDIDGGDPLFPLYALFPDMHHVTQPISEPCSTTTLHMQRDKPIVTKKRAEELKTRLILDRSQKAENGVRALRA